MSEPERFTAWVMFPARDVSLPKRVTIVRDGGYARCDELNANFPISLMHETREACVAAAAKHIAARRADIDAMFLAQGMRYIKERTLLDEWETEIAAVAAKEAG